MKTKISVSLPFLPKDIHVLVDLTRSVFECEEVPDFEISIGEKVKLFTSYEVSENHPLYLTDDSRLLKTYGKKFNKSELYNDLMNVLGKGVIPS